MENFRSQSIKELQKLQHGVEIMKKLNIGNDKDLEKNAVSMLK